MLILRVSAFHDSAAALLDDGCIVAAAQEERFTRKKHDARFPAHAIGMAQSSDRGRPPVCLSRRHRAQAHASEDHCIRFPVASDPFAMAIPIWMRENGEVRLKIPKLRRQISRTLFNPRLCERFCTSSETMSSSCRRTSG
jgi:carbamoyltransferase